MTANTEEAHRTSAVRGRAQLLNPLTGRYVKVDTDTGRIVENKKTPGPYKGIRVLTKAK